MRNNKQHYIGNLEQIRDFAFLSTAFAGVVGTILLVGAFTGDAPPEAQAQPSDELSLCQSIDLSDYSPN